MEDVARSVAVLLDVDVARSVAVLFLSSVALDVRVARFVAVIFVHLSKPAALSNAAAAAMRDRELG